MVSRAASAPGHFTTGVRGLTPPGSPRLPLQKRLIEVRVTYVMKKSAVFRCIVHQSLHSSESFIP